MPKIDSYIGFNIRPELKKEFQKMCLDKGTDITKFLTDYIKKAVNKHIAKMNEVKNLYDVVSNE